MVLSIMLGAALALVGVQQASAAPNNGVTMTVSVNDTEVGNGEQYGDPALPVLDEGDTVKFTVQYDTAAAGKSVTFEFGNLIDLDAVDLTNNDAIDSVGQNDNKVDITFVEDFGKTNQGVFTFQGTITSVDESAEDTLDYSIDREETSFDVIVRNGDDSFENVTDGAAKSLSPGNLNQYVELVEDDDSNEVVSVEDDIIGVTVDYTLTLRSETAVEDYPIADQLPEGLKYVENSFEATLTTWDENGLNKETNPFTFTPTPTGTPESFSEGVTIPESDAPFVLTITYHAEVPDEDARQTLEGALQDSYNALGGGTGSFSTTLTNTAEFGSEPDYTEEATVTLQGTVQGVNPGSAFDKTASWDNKYVHLEDDNSTLVEPQDLTYTLTADLTKWTGGPHYTLGQNVVIEDTLPANAEWNTGATPFLSSSDLTFDEVMTCPADAGDFASQSAGDYCVDDQTLLINVGKDTDEKYTIEAAAQITTIEGIDGKDSSRAEGLQYYKIWNTADFYYDGDSHVDKRADVNLYPLDDDNEDGVNDSRVFTKTGDVDETMVDPGETVTVDYAFTVEDGNDIDVRDSYIVDYIDADLFDFDDPSAIDVTGIYDGQGLDADDFEVGTDDDGNLTIALSDSGASVVDAQGADKTWVVHISLTTLPFDSEEPETKTITNKATLFGSDDEAMFWSSTQAESTSYGSEAEVRKQLFDHSAGVGENPWSDEVNVLTDADGNLYDSQQVYRIEFLPHGSYDGVVISDVNDLLPEGITFAGFVSPDDFTTVDETGPIDIGGNLEALYDEDTDTVTLRQQEDSRLNAGGVLDDRESIAAFFAVDIDSSDEPIANVVSGSEAIINPVVSSVSWSKVDGTSENAIAGSEWTITGNDDDNADVDLTVADNGDNDADSADGQLSVEGLDAGSYTLTETAAPEGYELDDASYEFEIDANDNAHIDLGDIANERVLGSVSWSKIDADTESPLAGSEWSLTGPDGFEQTVVDNGDNDADESAGDLTVENLPWGDYTLTETSAPAGYVGDAEVTFTVDADNLDIDLDAVTNTAKSYAVGDYTWIDTNGDGIQGDDEPVLEGVTVTLLDGDGTEIATSTTDADGRYLFDNLPAGDYQVKFELTDEQAAKYEFTTADAGSDDAADSDADVDTGLTTAFTLDDSNAALTTTYDIADVEASQGIDPTWDAGVVEKQTESDEDETPAPTPGDDETPAPTPEPNAPTDSNESAPSQPTGDTEELPETGSNLVWASLAALGLLAAGGAALLFRRRRTAHIGE